MHHKFRTKEILLNKRGWLLKYITIDKAIYMIDKIQKTIKICFKVKEINLNLLF